MISCRNYLGNPPIWMVKSVNKQIGQLTRKMSELVQRKPDIERKIEIKTNEDPTDVTERWDRDGFSWSSDAQRILKEDFHLETFRPLQKAAINAVMSKEDAIVVLSNGGGKSLCYQLPALLLKGLTVVVSPLVSLVEDQIMQLRKLGIDASSLNARTSPEEVKRVQDAISRKCSEPRLLYVTPEKLAKNKQMRNKLIKSHTVGYLKLIAIDEVHCCSHWGHDFRTDYAFLSVLKRQFEGVPILGLTATATSSVLDDVKEMLGIQAALVFRAGFNRPNIKYEVLPKNSNEEECLDEIAEIIQTRFAGQTGIVYCQTKDECEKVAAGLKSQNIRARYYHGTLAGARRRKYHTDWLSGKIQVIVATVAFGMGIDKPDVRFVIHHSIPSSIETYYQETGRAGRDGLPASCILMYRLADVFYLSTMIHYDRTALANLYSMMRYAINTGTCRRVRLAEHLEEPWEPSCCQKNCDVCENGNGETEKIDVSNDAPQLVQIIQENLAAGEDGTGRITGNKLLDLATKKLKHRTKQFLEHLIAHLLMENYLQEEFHETTFNIRYKPELEETEQRYSSPYNVISYIGIGTKWRDHKENEQILMAYGTTSNEISVEKSPEKTPNRKKKAENKEKDEEDMLWWA